MCYSFELFHFQSSNDKIVAALPPLCAACGHGVVEAALVLVVVIVAVGQVGSFEDNKKTSQQKAKTRQSPKHCDDIVVEKVKNTQHQTVENFMAISFNPLVGLKVNKEIYNWSLFLQIVIYVPAA